MLARLTLWMLPIAFDWLYYPDSPLQRRPALKADTSFSIERREI